MEIKKMILRNWKGIAKKEYEEKCINHLLYNTFPNLSKINGFIDAKNLEANRKRS